MEGVHDLFYRGTGVLGSVDTLLTVRGFGWPLFLDWECMCVWGGVKSLEFPERVQCRYLSALWVTVEFLSREGMTQDGSWPM